jgi:hypothetical protein
VNCIHPTDRSWFRTWLRIIHCIISDVFTIQWLLHHLLTLNLSTSRGSLSFRTSPQFEGVATLYNTFAPESISSNTRVPILLVDHQISYCSNRYSTCYTMTTVRSRKYNLYKKALQDIQRICNQHLQDNNLAEENEKLKRENEIMKAELREVVQKQNKRNATSFTKDQPTRLNGYNSKDPVYPLDNGDLEQLFTQYKPQYDEMHVKHSTANWKCYGCNATFDFQMFQIKKERVSREHIVTIEAIRENMIASLKSKGPEQKTTKEWKKVRDGRAPKPKPTKGKWKWDYEKIAHYIWSLEDHPTKKWKRNVLLVCPKCENRYRSKEGRKKLLTSTGHPPNLEPNYFVLDQ